MITRRKALRVAAATPVTALLVACGDNDDPPTPTPTPQPEDLPNAFGTPLSETPPSFQADSMSSEVNTSEGNYSRVGTMPGPGPDKESPVIIKWKVAHFDETRASPIVNQNLVILPIRDEVVALDLRNGAEVWKFTAGDRLYSSTTVESGVLYAGCNDGYVYAIGAASGMGLWKSYVGSAVHGAISASNGRIYLTTTGNSLRWKSKSILFALDATTGNELWRYDLQGASTHEGTSLASDVVYCVSEEGLVYAIDSSTGNEIWTYATKNEIRAPISIAEGIAYVPCEDGNLYALDASTGGERWRFRTGAKIQATPSIFDGRVYVGSLDSKIYSIDAKTGQEIWNSPWSTAFLSLYSAAITQDVGYWSSATIDLQSGTTIWNPKSSGYARPSTSAVTDGLVLTVDSEYLYCLGNLLIPRLAEDVVILGAPSSTAVERGTANRGDEISSLGIRNSSAGKDWVEVTIGGVSGWIPLDAIDPATLPPEGEIEYVHVP